MALAGAILATGSPVPLAAQDVPAEAVPPPSGIVPRVRQFAVGGGIGRYGWEEVTPYEDFTIGSLSIEVLLWRGGIRGRAGMGVGKTTLAVEEGERDTWVMPFDLQLLLAPDFGPFAGFPVMPYAVGGFGTLVTNPSGEGPEGDLPTRSQSQWTYGGGVEARVHERLEARIEGTMAGVRFADPFVGEERETQTIHNRRWEGRVSWLF